MKQLLDWLERIHKEMDAVDGKTVHREVREGHGGNLEREDIERIANALKRRETVRNR